MSDSKPQIQNKNGRRWAVLLPALVVPLAASFFYFVVYPGTAFGNAFYVVAKLNLLLWPILATLWILREPMVDKSLPRRHKASLIQGTLFGIAVTALLVFLVKATPLGAVVGDNVVRISERIVGLGVADYYLQFALFISFFHAALEEFYWRWFVFGNARRLMPAWGAITLAAVGFSSHHIVVLSQFFPLGWAVFLGACVGVGGAVWSFIYHRTNSMWGPWVSHMIIDLAIMWVGWEVLQAAGL
ncbi:MAG: CPBP family intramembrane metalloprotease [Verrucomicrobiales bacterium]|nr:CPBP family intramembrane metalloprotease [Verrucomicrobiales bacterium]